MPRRARAAGRAPPLSARPARPAPATDEAALRRTGGGPSRSSSSARSSSESASALAAPPSPSSSASTSESISSCERRISRCCSRAYPSTHHTAERELSETKAASSSRPRLEPRQPPARRTPRRRQRRGGASPVARPSRDRAEIGRLPGCGWSSAVRSSSRSSGTMSRVRLKQEYVIIIIS